MAPVTPTPPASPLIQAARATPAAPALSTGGYQDMARPLLGSPRASTSPLASILGSDSSALRSAASAFFPHPARRPMARPLFTEPDPAQGPLSRPLTGSPRAPASPRPSRRVFGTSTSGSDSSDSDTAELKDPDSPRFFDSPRHFVNTRLMSEYTVTPPPYRARYGSTSPTTSRGVATTKKTGAPRVSAFTLESLQAAVERTAGRRRGPAAAVGAKNDPGASSARQLSSGRAPVEAAVGVQAVTVHRGQSPMSLSFFAPAQGLQRDRDFVTERVLDLYQEYESLSLDCRIFNKLRLNPNVHESEIAVAWNMLLERLKVCQLVRLEIKAAHGSVEPIPFEMIYGEF